jgi:hypothetical protein
MERERQDKERLELERLEKERLERLERLERERLENERLEKERIERERLERERIERERLAALKSQEETSATVGEVSKTTLSFEPRRMTMEERERQMRQAEAQLRKQLQEERNRKEELEELERQKKLAEEAEKRKLERQPLQRKVSKDDLMMLVAQYGLEEDKLPLYIKENLQMLKQYRRLSLNITANKSNHAELKGLDAEISKKLESKFDAQAEKDALQWIEKVTSEKVFDFAEGLKSGKVLCKLINTLRPGTIPRYNPRPLPLMERDNLLLYLRACEQIGMQKGDLFDISDLYEKKNILNVIAHIYALARLVQSAPDYTGPTLGSVIKLAPKSSNQTPTAPATTTTTTTAPAKAPMPAFYSQVRPQPNVLSKPQMCFFFFFSFFLVPHFCFCLSTVQEALSGCGLQELCSRVQHSRH